MLLLRDELAELARPWKEGRTTLCPREKIWYPTSENFFPKFFEKNFLKNFSLETLGQSTQTQAWACPPKPEKRVDEPLGESTRFSCRGEAATIPAPTRAAQQRPLGRCEPAPPRGRPDFTSPRPEHFQPKICTADFGPKFTQNPDFWIAQNRPITATVLRPPILKIAKMTIFSQNRKTID